MLRSPAAAAALSAQDSTPDRLCRKLQELMEAARAEREGEADAKTQEALGGFVSVAGTVVGLLQG
jgi:hypothetical protein